MGSRRKHVASPSHIQGLGLVLLIGLLLGGQPWLASPVQAAALGEPGAWLSIDGRVTDLADGQPVEDAWVSAGGLDTRTDSQGQYSLQLPPGRYQVRFEAEGYGGASVVDGWQSAANKHLTAGILSLDMALPPLDPSPRQLRAAVDRLTDRPALSADLGGIAAPNADATSEGSVSIQSLDRRASAPQTVRVLMPDGEIVTMDMDGYLKGVVPAEMGFIFRRGFAALQAQAIASRSYAATRCLPASAGDPSLCEPGLDANVDTTTRTQVWRPVHYDITDAAVESTEGQVARAEGLLLDTLYFARALERTLPSEDSRCCAGRAWPHLRSVASPDAFDARRGHGSGMSQEGAAVLADWGATAAEIVGYYYTGARVEAPRQPRLYEGSVTPREGDAATVFNFRVRYADADGDAPAGHDLLIGDEVFEMAGPTEPGIDYSMGVSFSYSLTLPPGEHRVAFRFGDGNTEPIELDAGAIQVTAAELATSGDSEAADTLAAADDPESPPASDSEVQAGSARVDGDALQSVSLPDAPDADMLRSFGLLPEAGLDDAVESGASPEDAGAAPSLFEGPVLRADFDFMALAARWSGRLLEAEHVDLAVRTSRDGVAWSEWMPLLDEGEDARFTPPDPNAAGDGLTREGWTRLMVARGRYIQARAAIHGPSDGAVPAGLDLLEIHYFNSDAGPTAPKGQALRALALDEGPPVISRAAWGADEGKRRDAQGAEIWPPFYTTPRAQIVHHTVTTNDPADPAAVVRSIYHYHAVTRGWGDIGYNFLIDHRGNVYEGRYGGEREGRITQGGHALQYNSNSIGVALLGTFTESDRRPAAAAEAAVVELLAAKGHRYGIDPDAQVTLAGTRFAHSVMGHRDALPGHTQCPGDGLYGRLESMRTGVRVRMAELAAGGGQPAPNPTPPPAPPTAVPTRVPTSPPVASPQPAGCVELVTRGDFEAEDSAWQRNRAYYTAWDVYEGAAALFIGLRDEDPDEAQSYASAVQTLRLPARVESASLRFAARTRGDAGDIRLVRILGPNGAVIALGSERLPANSAWTDYRFDLGAALAPYAGQDLRLYFGLINNGDGKHSYMRLDAVSLVVCDGTRESTLPSATPPAPEPSATPAPATQAPVSPSPIVVPATEAPAEPTDAAYPGPGGAYVTATPGVVPRPGVICDTLLDDGFERDTLEGWRLGGDLPALRVSEPSFAGDAALRLGLMERGEDRFGYSAIARSVQMPRLALSATLSLHMAQLERGAEDSLIVELRRPATGERETLLRPGPVDTPDGAAEWQRYRLDLPAPWLEGDFELYMALLNRGQADAPGDVSALAIDEVSLEVCRLPGQAWLPQVLRNSPRRP